MASCHTHAAIFAYSRPNSINHSICWVRGYDAIFTPRQYQPIASAGCVGMAGCHTLLRRFLQVSSAKLLQKSEMRKDIVPQFGIRNSS